MGSQNPITWRILDLPACSTALPLFALLVHSILATSRHCEMSISTGSICSFGDYASSFTSSMSGKVINDPGIHEDTPRAAQLPGWCNEIHGKICVYDGDIGSYLRTFVPSRTPCPLDAPATALGLELTSGTPLVRPGHVSRSVRPLRFYSSMFSELW